MREGPLAALFRKTEEAEDIQGQSAQTPAEPATPAAATPAPPRAPVAQRPAPEPVEAPAPPRERGLPHPALSASPEAPEREVHVPSPQERLRHAFSSEIPESLMDRPAPRQAPPDYSREPSFSSAPAQVGQPIIRVVGVGGAGVNAVNRMVEAEVEGIEFLAVNTDLQSLQQSTADLTLHIGAELT
ncbi:MAG TPA: cell division protein FtsZ, partial [Solirubrobacteraceae bacterium]|nr:cell division protein FtsZ [Solirubrobacteraceae bacterium]